MVMFHFKLTGFFVFSCLNQSPFGFDDPSVYEFVEFVRKGEEWRIKRKKLAD